ncbi:lipocalin family protein [Acinetobacter bereziniae]|uniref:lipocalin family protein n=1 Tax=Acinetobacter bereziniae TaxID=106648 RepID=UPI001250B858|nr:lipocalin family protein [Acinetobacter bereziniae]
MNNKLRVFTLVSGIALLSVAALAHSEREKIPTAKDINLNKYLGQWHEITRKPLYFQKKCDYNVSAHYSLNENGSIRVDNTCYSQDGKLQQSIGVAKVQNAPVNSKLKVTFLPKVLRWLPVGRGDYWILKIDEDYQVALVGTPNKKYLWLLSRSQTLDPVIVEEYLNYAQHLGYDLKDLIYTKQK